MVQMEVLVVVLVVLRVSMLRQPPERQIKAMAVVTTTTPVATALAVAVVHLPQAVMVHQEHLETEVLGLVLALLVLRLPEQAAAAGAVPPTVLEMVLLPMAVAQVAH
jgi:hypothetical protein